AASDVYKRQHQYRIAVVSIENQICGGCYMKVPQQIEINVKKEEEIIFCPSCSRVLYIDKEMAQLSA
ncbi:MAG: C4-type zinc ribbon domain-containing protein, partial [Alphaproteobacteria bacterium]|nr:C4-type zinc ribbon domain-containing protein [Alphaproteobacteria bacterium]